MMFIHMTGPGIRQKSKEGLQVLSISGKEQNDFAGRGPSSITESLFVAL